MFLKRLANTLALKSNTAEDFAQAYYEALSIADSDFSLCLIPLANENIQAKNPLDPFIRYLKHHPESKKKLSKNAGKACILAVPSETQHGTPPYIQVCLLVFILCIFYKKISLGLSISKMKIFVC